MKLGDGLFLNTFRRVAEDYKTTGIEFNDMIVDNTWVPQYMPMIIDGRSPNPDGI